MPWSPVAGDRRVPTRNIKLSSVFSFCTSSNQNLAQSAADPVVYMYIYIYIRFVLLSTGTFPSSAGPMSQDSGSKTRGKEVRALSASLKASGMSSELVSMGIAPPQASQSGPNWHFIASSR